MKKTKTDQAKEYFINKEYKKAFKIFKTFKSGFSKDEIKIIWRAYEMYSNENFYMSLGFDFQGQLNKSIQIIKDKYKIV